MAAVLGASLHELLPDLGGQHVDIGTSKRLEITGRGDAL
jgi:hypothetical protein